MTDFYDARGNVYAVVSPQRLREMGVALPDSPRAAAKHSQAWTAAAIAACCAWPDERPAGAKAHRSDGLLVGPFQAAAPFDVLIVNTDGSLAERSGNGLTIFSQALLDRGHSLAPEGVTLCVHHRNGVLATQGLPVDNGFWLDIGQPIFGPDAAPVSQLEALNPDWCSSQFVQVGNPHCVTLLEADNQLPAMALLRSPEWHTALQRIAFAPPIGDGVPCPAGVNLQWAAHIGEQRVAARVFERGEGATESSGTSASAVVSAAWKAGWLSGGEAWVEMPGGVAPFRLEVNEGVLERVWLFGVAVRCVI